MKKILLLVIVFIIGLVVGFTVSDGDPAGKQIVVPASAIELTKCVPNMGYHRADPATLPQGPIYLLDGQDNVVGIEYLLTEEQLEQGIAASQEVFLPAFDVGFTNVSLAYAPEGLGEISAPLYALHLYKLSETDRANICDGEELESDHMDETMEETSGSSGLIVGNNAIAVSDQPAGNDVRVSLVVLAQDGFVVIHESLEGKPGKIIGSSSVLSKGTHSNIEVALDETYAEGTEMFAMLHTDNDDGGFDAAVDPAVKENDNIVMMKFRLDNSADLPADTSF